MDQGSGSFLSVAVVEDQRRDQEHIVSLLRRFEEETGTQFRVTTFDSGAALLDCAPTYDLIIMDIQMPRPDGMATAREIRRVDKKVEILFVTKTSQYATHGYAVDALGYVVKPVTYFAFKSEMERFLATRHRGDHHYVLLGAGSQLERVNIDDIVYFASNRHRITTYMTGGELTFNGTLKSLEKQLSDKEFFRSNSGYLVNLRHLIAIDGDQAVMSDGQALKISRSRKKTLLDALANYVGSR